MRDQHEIQLTAAIANYYARWNRPNMDYIEVQIWKTLSLKDVTAFEYKTVRPTGNFLERLTSLGIEIIDGRTDSPDGPK